MNPSTWVFDAKGDTIITLKTSKWLYNWWEDKDTNESSFLRTGLLLNKDVSTGSDAEERSDQLVEEPPQEDIQLSSNEQPQNPTSNDIKKLNDETTNRNIDGSSKVCDAHARTTVVQMRVSSRHLALASPVFLKTLTGPFIEGATDDQDLYRVSASDFDPEAFTILLNIIHGHHRDVPRSISLDMLARIACIVDYYQCHEIVEIFVDVWLKALGKPPTTYGRDSMFWLLISWVFSQADAFKNMARLALKNSQNLIWVEDIPIPYALLDKIESERQDALEVVFSAIYVLYNTLCHHSNCTFECSCLLLGYLTKELYKYKILRPQVTRPFYGHSIESVKRMIDSFKPPNYHDYSRRRRSYSTPQCHGIRQRLNLALQRVEEERLHVFNLEDYRSPADEKRDGLAIRWP